MNLRPTLNSNDEGEPWDWIPHVDGADRQKEINAYLRLMLDKMEFAKGPMVTVSNSAKTTCKPG